MLPILWIKCICIIYTRTYKQPGSLKSFVLLLSNIFEVCNTPIFWRILFYSKIIDVMCGNVRPISISQTKTFWTVIPCDRNDTILLSINYISTYYLFWNRLTCCVSSFDNRQDSIMCILGQAVMSYDTFDMYVCSSVIFFSSSHPRFAHWCILSPKSCNISQSSYSPQRGLLLGIYNFEKSQITKIPRYLAIFFYPK